MEHVSSLHSTAAGFTTLHNSSSSPPTKAYLKGMNPHEASPVAVLLHLFPAYTAKLNPCFCSYFFCFMWSTEQFSTMVVAA